MIAEGSRTAAIIRSFRVQDLRCYLGGDEATPGRFRQGLECGPPLRLSGELRMIAAVQEQLRCGHGWVGVLDEAKTLVRWQLMIAEGCIPLKSSRFHQSLRPSKTQKKPGPLDEEPGD